MPRSAFPALALLAALAAPVLSGAQAPAPTAAPPVPHGPHLEGDTATIPLVLVKGYPFIEGSINGKAGKLLFDIGDARTLTLNSHVLSPPGGVVTGHGFFGSGQTFQTMRFPAVDSLTLPGGLHYEGMTNLPGQPGLPLEQHITPDFIGWIGLDYFKGYVLKLDYSKPSATFFHDDADGAGVKAAEAGKPVVQTIKVANLAQPNLLVAPMTVGGAPFSAVFDTGSHTSAWLSEAQVAALVKSGVLKPKGEDYEITGIVLDGRPLPPMPIQISHETPPFAKLLPRQDLPILVLGYEFLKLQPTVWDYGRGTVTLLKP